MEPAAPRDGPWARGADGVFSRDPVGQVDVGWASEGDPPVEMLANQHAKARTRATARLPIDLQHPARDDDGVIGGNDPLVLLTEDRVEIHGPEGHEGGRWVAGLAPKRGVVLRDVPVAEVPVRRIHRADSGDAQFIHQPPLERPIHPLTAPARLGRIGRNVFDAELVEGPAHRREARLVDGTGRRGREERPPRTVRIEGHRETLGPDDVGERTHHGQRRFLRPQLRIEERTRRVIDHGDERCAGFGHERQPAVPTAIQVQELAEAGPRLAAPTVPPTCLPFGEQPRLLQGLLHVAVRQRHGVLAPRDLVEVPTIESRVPLSIELEHALELRHWHATLRRRAPLIHQAVVAPALVALPPPAEIARRHPQNLRGLEPVNLTTHRPQNHVLHPHRPLPRGWRILHGASTAHFVLDPPVKRTDHLLSRADTS